MTDKTDALIEQVEQMVGMGHAAWDMINPREIAAAFYKALAAPAEGDGPVATTVRFLDGGIVQMDRSDYERITRPAATAQVQITDEMVERACKRYAFREDGAAFPDAYSEYEVLAERTLMREFLTHVLATATKE